MGSIGDRLRLKRLSKRLNQGSVARRAGISQPFLSLIEKGTKKPSPELVERIESAINSLTGKWTVDQMLRRIAYLVRKMPFPDEGGGVFYWQATVEGKRLVLTSGDMRIEVERELYAEDRVAMKSGHGLASAKVTVKTPNEGKDMHWLLEPYPKTEDIANGLRLAEGTKAYAVLFYLGEFFSRWWTAEPVDE